MKISTRLFNIKHIQITIQSTLIFLFIGVAYYAFRTTRGDFAYFYYAFEVILKHHPMSDLYNIPLQHQWFRVHGFLVYPYNQYVYPPQFAYLFSWLALFSIPVATKIWSFMNIFFYVLTVLLVNRLANTKRIAIITFVILITALFNLPFWWDLVIGNANWLIFSLLGISIYFRYSKRYYWIAGIPLGFAIVFKVTPIVFLLYILLRKEWRFAIGALCSISISTIFTIFAIGIAPFKFYLLHLSQFTATSMKNGNAPYNSSLIGILGNWNQHHFISLSTLAIHNLFTIYELIMFILIFITAITFNRHPTADYRPDVAIGILSIILFSPLIEGPHLLIACLSAWILIAYWWDKVKESKQKVKIRSTTVGQGIYLCVICLFLSPLNWILRIFIPSENFYALLLLTVATFSYAIKMRV